VSSTIGRCEKADAASFAAYEAGPVKAAAAADRELGWGRDGIAISLRKAYRRLYRREGPQGRATAWRVAAVAEIPAGAAIDWRTWAAAHREGLDLYEALDATPGPLAVVCVERGTAHDQPPSVVEGPASQAWCGDDRMLWAWSR
jgi:hypothetical protein